MLKSLFKNQLCLTPQYFFTRGKMVRSQAKKLQIYKNNPEKYVKTGVMKLPNLRDMSLSFPLKIPIRYKYVYTPPKYVERVKAHDFLSFDNLTGNEILLYLEQADQLRSVELTNALVELGKRPNADKINWNDHEYVQKSISILKTEMPQYKSYSISQLCLALDRLKIEDQEIWRKIEEQCRKHMHAFSPHGFAIMVKAFMGSQNRCNQDFHQLIVEQIPTKLWKMSPKNITDCFQDLVQQKMISKNSHLFENHFLVLFWRRHSWFGANNYWKILDGLYSLQYDEHEDFWDIFLFQIVPILSHMTEQTCNLTLNALQQIQSDFESVDCTEQIDILKKHKVFLETNFRAAENSKLFNVILQDLTYYKEKKKLEKLKQASAQQGN